MPRIRKKTSKRTQLHQRARIKHKAVETRKKRSKEAKKNVQWKSKTPKDPGIPANFPFKDQILAEIVEERRQVAEAKEIRKQERKAAKDNGLQAGPVESVESSKTTNAIPPGTDDDEVPTLLNPDYPTFQAILDKSDVVIHVIDARDPLPFRSSHLEELVGTKSHQKLLLILNKIDACPREAVAAWAAYLRTQYTTFIFRSASSFLPEDVKPQSKGKEKVRTDDALGVSSILSCLSQWSKSIGQPRPLYVAVTGVTNSGKSSFINSLLRKAACPIYKLSTHSPRSFTTTIVPQEVSLEFSETTIHLIDTPGLSWNPSSLAEDDFDSNRARDILLRSRGRVDRLKDPIPVLNKIVSHATKQDLMLFYNLPAFADNDPTAFLSGVARSNGLTKKGGDPDLNGAAKVVLRDWSVGKLPRYTVPPSYPISEVADDTLSSLYSKDEAVLAQLRTRTEMRRGDGIVKLVPGVIDVRQIDLEAGWISDDSIDLNAGEEGVGVLDVDLADGESEEEEGEDAGEDDDEEDENENENEEDEDEDEGKGEEEHQVPIGKRKRPPKPTKSQIPSSRPSKKVAFSSTRRPASRASTTGSPTKSALKKTTPASKKGKTGVHQAIDGEQAYDFGKFF